MIYTYDDWKKAAEESGILGQFSASDLKLAQQNPDAGMSLLTYKKDYASAKTDDLRALANAGANSVRSKYGGYTGGTAGSDYKLSEERSPSNFYREEYTSPYKDKITSLTDRVANNDFSYSTETDPNYSAYKKAYTREGERATKDALGQASTATGGIPSTYATTAAAQAGQYYGSKLADKVPELRQQAFQNHMTEKNIDLAILDALNTLDSTEYGRYTDDRDFDYSQLLDDIGVSTQRDNTKYAREQAQKELDLKILEGKAGTMAQAGRFDYMKDLYGLNPEDIAALQKLWNEQNAPKQTYSGGGSYRRRSSYSGGYTPVDNTPVDNTPTGSGFVSDFATMVNSGESTSGLKGYLNDMLSSRLISQGEYSRASAMIPNKAGETTKSVFKNFNKSKKRKYFNGTDLG